MGSIALRVYVGIRRCMFVQCRYKLQVSSPSNGNLSYQMQIMNLTTKWAHSWIFR